MYEVDDEDSKETRQESRTKFVPRFNRKWSEMKRREMFGNYTAIATSKDEKDISAKIFYKGQDSGVLCVDNEGNQYY